MHPCTVSELPNRDRQAERREATRLEILDAAWEVAREEGLAAITLRAVARRVGMRAPSLYTHVDSKMAIYDAMFGQAWGHCLDRMQRAHEVLQAATVREALHPRDVLLRATRAYFDFALEDPVRHQLMDLRTIPGFVPSPTAYEPAVAVLDLMRQVLADLAVTRDEDVDLATALLGGLINAQLANDPGGDRWSRQFDRAMEMYADAVGLPPRD